METIHPSWYPILGMLIPVILVPVILGLKHARVEREMEHAERMKALEMGRTLPQDEPWWTPVRVAVIIGAGVPVGVFALAWLSNHSTGDHQDAWMAAMLVGTAGVIGGTFLAWKAAPSPQARDASAATKPPVDADAFDIVGRRG